jgi:predicted O-methyltransferase YrrM
MLRAVLSGPQIRITASRVLHRWPINRLTYRIAHLVGPPMLHQLFRQSALVTSSASEATAAVAGEHADFRDEYAIVRDRVASNGSALEGNYPEDYKIEDGTASLLYTLVRHLHPDLVMEVGVADGRATQIILSALDANGSGRLVSVDIKSDVGGAATGHPRWSLHVHGSGKSSSKQLQHLITQVGPPDFFFHDASHTYYDQYAEYLVAWERMRPGSLFASDDVDQSFAFLDFTKALNVKPVVLVDRRKALGLLLRG